MTLKNTGLIKVLVPEAVELVFCQAFTAKMQQCANCGCTYVCIPEPWLKRVTQGCPWCIEFARKWIELNTRGVL